MGPTQEILGNKHHGAQGGGEGHGQMKKLGHWENICLPGMSNWGYGNKKKVNSEVCGCHGQGGI